MNIFFPCLDKTVPILKTALYSVLNHNDNVNFYIIFIGDQLSKDNINEISKISDNIIFIDVGEWIDVFRNTPPLKNNHLAYARLLMPRICQLYFTNIKQFIYCDEDCYCCGKINPKFVNLDLKEYDFAAFEEYPSTLVLRRIGGNISTLFPSEYTCCSGLCIIKTQFDILSEKSIFILKLLHGLNTLNTKSVFMHDQFFINTYGVMNIKCGSAYPYKNWDERYHQLISHQLKHIGIAHTYRYKNDENKLIKDKFISKKAIRKDRGTEGKQPRIIVCDPTDEVIMTLREILFVERELPVEIE